MGEVEHEEGGSRVRADRLRELSDTEFVDLLRETQGGRGWVLGQVIELERRGTHLVEGDPSLAQGFSEYQERLADAQRTLQAGLSGQGNMIGDAVERMREATAATLAAGVLDQWNSIGDRLAGVAPLFPEIKVRFAPPALPAVEDLSLSEFEALPPPSSLEMQVAQLEALGGIRQEIQSSRKHDWFDWLTLGLVAVAALTSFIALILTFL